MAEQFDVDSIRQRLITGLQSKNLWAKLLATSTGRTLIDNYSEEEGRFAQYTEYLLRENKWSLAQNRSSLVSQAQINGYDPARKTGSSGILKVGVSEAFDTPPIASVSIPKNSIFSNGEINFSSLDAYTITPADTSIEIEVIQGTPLTFNFLAQGINFESFQIANDSLDNNSYELYVNDVLWSSIRDIREATLDETRYQIINELDFSGITLRFGNSIFGKRLENGDTVRFECYETVGDKGNITGTSIVTTVVSTLFDVDSNKVEAFVTNESKLTGGSGIESKESIRENAPRIGQSGNSATTNSSYEAVIETISFVGKAVVWGAIEQNQDQNLPYSTFIASEENLIRISAFTDSGDQLSQAQQDEIIDLIQDRKAPTDIPNFVEVDFVRLKFNVSAFGNVKTLPLSQLKGNILSGLQSTYDLFQFEFKQPLYESDYVSYIDSISGVGNHNTTIEVIFETLFLTSFTADIDLEISPIVNNSMKIYIRDNSQLTPTWVLIGTSDTNGDIQSEVGFDLTGSIVNTSTGIGNLKVVSGLSGDFRDYDIKIYYQTVSRDLVPSRRNQILTYEEADITVQYQPNL